MGGGNIFSINIFSINCQVLLLFPMDRRIFHIKEKLSQDLGGSWSVGEMAAEFEMSVSYFQRLFKEKAGTTPSAYLTDLRLDKAVEMLSDPNCFLQIKEIGFQVGLTNDSHFTSGFKKKYGMTPTEYRAHQAAIHQSIPPDGQE